ncbi:unnamed protein product [Lasius platythorax]|uniref:Uncharacterized protein n=1 Tax=Lasius platythorax TaxID=488582 RepID=A0AAV2NDD5_9HYME
MRRVSQVKTCPEVAWWRLANRTIASLPLPPQHRLAGLASSFRFSSETLSWPPTAVRASSFRDSLFVVRAPSPFPVSTPSRSFVSL